MCRKLNHRRTIMLESFDEILPSPGVCRMAVGTDEIQLNSSGYLRSLKNPLYANALLKNITDKVIIIVITEMQLFEENIITSIYV